MNYLIIGACGVGKTWVMKALLNHCDKRFKAGKILFHEGEKIIVTGKYTGDTFDGSDRLSMSAITDVHRVAKHANGKATVWEGDRFTNTTFISQMKPTILLIKGDGAVGRMKRGSKQTERHIKAIATRVSRVKPNHTFENSTECFIWLQNKILNETH